MGKPLAPVGVCCYLLLNYITLPLNVMVGPLASLSHYSLAYICCPLLCFVNGFPGSEIIVIYLSNGTIVHTALHRLGLACALGSMSILTLVAYIHMSAVLKQLL